MILEIVAIGLLIVAIVAVAWKPVMLWFAAGYGLDYFDLPREGRWAVQALCVVAVLALLKAIERLGSEEGE